MIKVYVNNIEIQIEDNATIKDACGLAGFKIPTLCFMKNVNEDGNCRVCVVEIEGNKNLVSSCSTLCNDGMKIITNSEKVLKARKTNIELLLSNHNNDCLSCPQSLTCRVQKLAREYNCTSKAYYGDTTKNDADMSSPCIQRIGSKCILCKRCVSVCSKVQTVNALCVKERGFNTKIGCAFDKKLKDSTCVECGQCILACPTAALIEKQDISKVLNALSNKNLHTIVAAAPSVRVALGEEFGLKTGTNVEGKMITALKMLGFAKVFDINFGADLTIMEEAHEFLEHFQTKKVPLFTSCCPGWINFVNKFYPELLPNVSSCKSPQQMFGATCKTYYAEKNNIDASKIFVVTIMPCIAKKGELLRLGMNASGFKDVDVSITTRELANMIRQYGIDFASLPESKFEDEMGLYSGAGVIFGTTGGVMEAALRTVSEKAENKSLNNPEFLLVRGEKGIKETELVINGQTVKLAVVSGLKQARAVIEDIKSGKKQFDFVEIMACPGGCVCGGGQPKKFDEEFLSQNRAKSLYEADKSNLCRTSHGNPSVINIYKNYFGEPGGEIAKKILHATPKK